MFAEPDVLTHIRIKSLETKKEKQLRTLGGRSSGASHLQLPPVFDVHGWRRARQRTMEAFSV